jgi:hypothetical protein
MRFQSKLLKASSQFMYHRTHPDRVEAILRDGLKLNSEVHLTQAGSWSHRYYGCNPIYLSQQPDEYKVDGSALLKVDVAGLPLVADLPGIVSAGFLVEEDGMYEYDEDDDEFDDDGELLNGDREQESFGYEELVDPDSWEVEEAMKLTRTCAVLQDIEPSRITRLA